MHLSYREQYLAMVDDAAALSVCAQRGGWPTPYSPTPTRPEQSSILPGD